MATVTSQKELFTFFWRDGMDNSLYHREFVTHVETIETYGGTGAIGITPTFVAQKLHEMHAALSPLINLETQHDGRNARIWMKKIYYFYVVVEGQKGFAREHQMDFMRLRMN
jgi:hypothetical protein